GGPPPPSEPPPPPPPGVKVQLPTEKELADLELVLGEGEHVGQVPEHEAPVLEKPIPEQPEFMGQKVAELPVEEMPLPSETLPPPPERAQQPLPRPVPESRVSPGARTIRQYLKQEGPGAPVLNEDLPVLDELAKSAEHYRGMGLTDEQVLNEALAQKLGPEKLAILEKYVARPEMKEGQA